MDGRMWGLGGVLLMAWLGTSAGAGEVLHVDTASVLRTWARPPFGLNVNYLMDHGRGKAPARPLAVALKEMGARFLRFPGGDKSDSHLFALPPYEKPEPTLARTGSEEWPSADRQFTLDDHRTWKIRPLDFDEFMALCREAEAEPVICVCFDAMYKPAQPGGTAPTREELLAHAVGWVKYANVTKKYGVTYWELGNESYLGSHNGSPSAVQYAQDAAAFARAMKAVDPAIRIGLNGPERHAKRGAHDPEAAPPWWKAALESAGPHADWLALHDYPCWKWMGYAHYTKLKPDFQNVLLEGDRAVKAYLPPEQQGRMRLLMTEVNSADWFGHPKNDGWKHVNTLGHALVLFDMLGVYLRHETLDAVLVWNTRWVKNATENQLWDAVGPDNELRPTGQVMALWKRAFLPQIVSCAGGPEAVRAHACYDPKTRRLSVFLINRIEQDRALRLEVPGLPEARVERTVFSGAGPEDERPQVKSAGALTWQAGGADLQLPPVSLTVLEFAP
ncbi:MAG: hypothetical protein AMXMBFR7_34370 [Planctomycetota bacterium]